MLRTHTCNDLRETDVNKEVILAGWVHTIRAHGDLVFIDLRDKYGITQLVLHAETFPDVKNIRKEFVIQIKGTVRKKPEPNKKLETGAIEIAVNNLTILNTSDALPIDLENYANVTEENRLKYRYLDLRRPPMQRNIMIKHLAMQAAREYMNNQGFMEIETPMLIRSTPEGARDYLVPSRVHHGKAYSLPQSPQIYKQILMVAGFDKYYQIARCLRDEDLRADRQPEFTQIDVEMSFCEQEDVFKIGEGLMKNIWKHTIHQDIKIPFPKFTYDEAMLKYGSDKPDIRYELFLHDLTQEVKNSDFGVFNSVIADGGIVKGMCVDHNFVRKDIDELTEIAKIYKAKGLVALHVIREGDSLKLDGGPAKYLSKEIQMNIARKLDAKDGSAIFIVADQFKICNDALGNVRKEIAKKLKLYDERSFAFCWITNFPLYEWDPDGQKWDAAHHIFTMPNYEHLDILEKDPGNVRAQCYDLVLNGIEIASGSIRINRRDVQERVMNVIGLTMEDVEEKFGFMLEAFRYGAPPHGGFAPGLDRIVALICGTNDIREVIAFPKNKQGENPMDGCPSPIDASLLKDLGLKVEK
jgi:aspartyl-tRNA synthetase